MSETELQNEPTIPTAIWQVLARLNDRLLPQRQRLLHDTASNGYFLVDWSRSKPLSAGQIDRLARDQDTLAPNEVIIYPS